MEDQPADTGDLTTEAEATPDVNATARSRRHRMPRGKARVRADGDAAEVIDRSVAETSADETVTVSEDSATAEPATQEASPRRRRRWPLPWRRSTPADEPSQDDEITTDEAVADDSPDPVDPVDAEGTVAADSEEGPTEDDDTTETVSESIVFVPHRPAGRRLKIAAAAAAALFVAAGAFAAATLQPYLADRALVHTKTEVARTAANGITTLWTYTPENMESLPTRAARFLGGDFAAEYRNYIDAIVATNQQAQVSNDTQVMGTAVESLTPSEATAIVYTNSVATSPVSKNIPSLRYLAYRLTLERGGSDWLITNMTAVTQLDLTPQL